MRSFSEIITAIGVKRLSEALELPDNHVRGMRHRDSIPVDYWSTVLKLLPEDSGIDIETLHRFRDARFGRSARRRNAEHVVGEVRP